MLGGHSNTMVHLAPLPLVARVATGTGLVRSGTAWLAREVEVARYVAAVGAPAVRPSTLLDRGPHTHDGIAVSFWSLVAIRPEPADLEAASRSLRRCHEALDGYAGELPALGVIDETLRLLDHPRVAASLSDEDRHLLDRFAARWNGAREFLDGVRMRPLHGDAHLQNLCCTEAGPIWGDWGDVFAGPIEWDLACLISASIVLGGGSEAAAFLPAYGGDLDADLLGLMAEARTLQAVVWASLLSSDAVRNPRLRAKLAWLQSRLSQRGSRGTRPEPDPSLSPAAGDAVLCQTPRKRRTPGADRRPAYHLGGSPTLSMVSTRLTTARRSPRPRRERGGDRQAAALELCQVSFVACRLRRPFGSYCDRSSSHLRTPRTIEPR